MNILQRLNKVMKEVTYVQKDKSVTGGGQNYKAVTYDQLVSVARASMVENGIIIIPRQVSGGFLQMRDMNAKPEPVKMGLYSGTYAIDFINIEDAKDLVTVTIEANANDNGDKAPGKALTYAVKSATLKVLFLESGDDEESRADLRNPDLISEDDATLMTPHLVAFDGTNYTWTHKGALLSQQFGFNGVDQIRVKDLGKIKKALGL